MEGQEYNLSEMRELTTSQYDSARNAAIQRIQKRIGDKPRRADFKQDYAPLWGTLDILAIVIFIAAVMVSSLHILVYAGGQAQASFIETRAIEVLGIKPTQMIYGLMHQAGLLAIAESAMLLFFVMARINTGFARWGNGALALLACIFVVVANWNSGLNEFLSLLVPAFTIGIGFRLEDRITENMRRSSEIDTQYRHAINEWAKASSDPTKHPEWLSTLAVEVWQKLVGYKSNQSFIDAPADFRRLAVSRELEKENWAKGQWLVLSPGQNGQTRTQRTTQVRPLPTVQDAGTNGHRNIGHGTGYEKDMSAPDKVRKHLEDNPQDADLSVRELGERLGVGKSTVHNVMKEMRTVQSNGHLSNGHIER